MSRRTELIALLLADGIALAAANTVYYFGRFEWQWFGPPVNYPVMWLGVASFTLLWMALFVFFGLYRERYAASRFDELVSVGKVITIGILILFFLIFIDELDQESGKYIIVFHWAVLYGFVALGRIAVRSIQKRLILKGKGLHRALIVGWTDQVEELYEEVARYPAAGLEVVGALRMRREGQPAAVTAGGETTHAGDGNGALNGHHGVSSVEPSIDELPHLIDELEVQDVLIALGSDDHRPLMEVLRLCDGKSVSLKLVPDFYTIIGGMARTEHMYGLPLIEVLPEPMQPWEVSTKRLFDLVVSLVVLVAGAPFWLLIAILVRLTSHGPAIYRQRRVGQHGKAFTMYKFRTMHQDAERHTGPVWAQRDDPRYTRLGRWLRRTRLDEVPQFVNVLKGEMSLVGPRPERPYFVERLAREIPLYNRRHRVKPGITGWAQVTWKYDQSLDDVKQKVKFDLFYIENVSLRMDFKILFRTLRTALTGKGQ